jgi:hypothetical protein
MDQTAWRALVLLLSVGCSARSADVPQAGGTGGDVVAPTGGTGLVGIGGGTGGVAPPPPDCTTNLDCDDHSACTIDSCAGGSCVYSAFTCPPSSYCDPIQGCVTTVTCPTGQAPCAAGCRDLLSDPANCGACDRDCGGSACTLGRCAPVLLGTGLSVFDVAVDGSYVYYAESTALRRCPKTGCGAGGDVLLPNQPAHELRLVGDRLYFLVTDMIGKISWVSVSGGAEMPAATGIDYAHGLAPDPLGGVSWTDYDGVMRPGVQVYLTSEFVADVEADAAGVLFSIPVAGQGLGQRAGYVARCPFTGCNNAPQEIAPDQVAGMIAIDATQLYWAACTSVAYPCVGTAELRACPITGCVGAPTVLATGLGAVYEFAVDGSHVYWTQNGPGAVMRCPLTGCGAAPEVVAANQPSPGGIALDQTHVYWVTGVDAIGSSTGSVYRVAK